MRSSGCLTVGRALDVTVVRTGCAHHPLVLHGGDDVVVSAVSVLGRIACVPELESDGGDDGSYLEDLFLLLVGVVDCSLLTGLLTDSALAVENHLTVVGVDESDPGNCLCVRDVDCLPGGESVLELVGDVLGGTLSDTVTAAGTLFELDVPGLLLDRDLEVSSLSVDLNNL